MTTVRATPMWLMASYKIDGDKMVLSGEGADELFEGICIFTPMHKNSTKKMYVS
jgi:asparagine synthetase B (glutamine-hydrolysing)